MKAKDFNTFLNEARGFSKTSGEYADLCISLVNHHFERYMNFDFKKGTFTNFSVPIKIDDAYAEVSPGSARDFPIDSISIDFKITVNKSKSSQSYRGYYLRNYDKVKVKKNKDKVDIIILCHIMISREQMHLSPSKAYQDIADIMYHEMTHAYNDYKKPGGLSDALTQVRHKMEQYDFKDKSRHLNSFLYLLYALSNEEIVARLGERKKFDTKGDLMRFSGYRFARRGIEFNANKYYTNIVNELMEYPALDYIISNFGELFVKEYKKITKEYRLPVNPKILTLKKNATLNEVLHYFEKYLNSQGDKLKRKLVKKLEVQ